MKNLIIKLFSILGFVIGEITRCVYPLALSFPLYIFTRNFHTSRLKGKFTNFGKGSLLGKDTAISGHGTIRMGNNSSILGHAVLETISSDAVIIIGDGVSIGEYCHITALRKVTIGNGVLTGRYVLITDNSHGRNDGSDCNKPPILRDTISKGPIKIEDNVWIGDKATILPGVTIGEGSIIAANAVVTKSVPAFSVAAGCPVKIIRKILQ